MPTILPILEYHSPSACDFGSGGFGHHFNLLYMVVPTKKNNLGSPSCQLGTVQNK